MTGRIALISEHASPLGVLGGVDSGGQNVYVGQVARGLAAGGYSVDVFTRRDSEHLPDVVEWAPGVRIVHVRAGPAAYVCKEEMLPFMGDFTASMLRFAAGEKGAYDLLHANFWMSGLVAADIKRLTRTPFVVTFHGLGRIRRTYQGMADRFPDARFAVEDRIIDEADAIIAECPQDEEDLIRLYHADPAKITIIPCGFDPSELSPVDKAQARATLGLAPDEPIILQLGRMVPRKGVDTVIRGFARLLNRHAIAARLLIVGGNSTEPDPRITPETGRLQAVAAEEGVAEHVAFVGHRSRDVLKYWYSAADIFAVTPWYESFGITPVEAMACGAPVIGTDVGGIKYSVRDGETGYLVPPDEPDALADRMAYLLRHPELLEQMGRQAIRRANELFTWQQVASAVAELYANVLKTERLVDMVDGTAHTMAIIDRGFAGMLEAVQESRRRLRPCIVEAAETIGTCFLQGGKLLICGNGGSAADAQHFAAELVGRFKREGRPGLPALALTADTAMLTAWSNDIGFDDVFARQVEAFGRAGDVLLGISTSGRSHNLVCAFERARRQGLRCIALLGRDGGDLLALADVPIVVPSFETQHIQEVHMVVIHLLCELVEERHSARQQYQSEAPAPVESILELPARRSRRQSSRAGAHA